MASSSSILFRKHAILRRIVRCSHSYFTGARFHRIAGPLTASECHPAPTATTISLRSTLVDGTKIFERSVQTKAPSPSASDEESTWTVVPEDPQEEKWILLSALDKFILPIYIPVYFIYNNIPAESLDKFVEKLRCSLAKVLVPYYPWAGRLKKNPETQSWDLHCDNGGVNLKVVHVNEKLRETKFSRPCLELRLLAPRLDAVPREDAPPVPALAIQVTRFKCGAVALGCNFHHQCGDAHAVGMFMQAWSELTRGEPLSVHPIHDRADFVPTPSSQGQGDASPPPVAIVGTGTGVAPSSTSSTSSTAAVSTIEQDFGDCRLEALVYDKEALRELKALAPGSTSFEAATAFVVRHVARLSGDDDDTAKFVLMVDFRGRFSAAAFAGNLALPKAVVAPRRAFVDGPLVNAVAPVHDAVKGADDAYFRAFAAYAGRGPPRKERAMAVSSCARLGLYAVDFGLGGPCFAGVNPPVPRLVPEFVLFLPNASEGDGFVVYLQMESALLEKLLQDPDFSSIGTKYRPLGSEVDDDCLTLPSHLGDGDIITTTQHSRI